MTPLRSAPLLVALLAVSLTPLPGASALERRDVAGEGLFWGVDTQNNLCPMDFVIDVGTTDPSPGISVTLLTDADPLDDCLAAWEWTPQAAHDGCGTLWQQPESFSGDRTFGWTESRSDGLGNTLSASITPSWSPDTYLVEVYCTRSDGKSASESGTFVDEVGATSGWTFQDNGDGTCTAYDDANHNGQQDPGEAGSTVPCSASCVTASCPGCLGDLPACLGDCLATCIVVNPSGDAYGQYVGVGSGNAQGSLLAVGETGESYSTGGVAVSGSCADSDLVSVSETCGAHSNWVAVSKDGTSSTPIGVLAVSGGDADAGLIAVSLHGDAHACQWGAYCNSWLFGTTTAVSTGGDATAEWIAISTSGASGAGFLSVSGTGHQLYPCFVNAAGFVCVDPTRAL